MKYIVYDLEFNQDYDILKETKTKVTAKCPFEILQLGALKLNEKLQRVSTLNRLVKPEIYKNLNPFVKEITGIRMDQLTTAKPFKEIFQEFTEFMKDDSSVLCVWGITDIKELFRNMEYHEIGADSLPREYINIQSYASKYFNCPKGTSIGLRNAVELLNISLSHPFHDAFNDAFYTAEVFKKIYSDQMVPQIYIPEKHRIRNSQNTEKKIIDTNNLLKQFEKMFNREMTAEEKAIIKLAYKMGMTNQFKINKI
jgi:inhibitor of KinA sporulation pathway (predicted exonuclease)